MTRRPPVYVFVDGDALCLVHEARRWDSFMMAWRLAPDVASRFVDAPPPDQSAFRRRGFVAPDADTIFWGPVSARLEAAKIVRIDVERWWPGVVIRYRGPYVVETYALGDAPWPGWMPTEALQREGEALESVLTWAATQGVAISEGGWADAPVVAFETAELPERTSSGELRAGYRTSARVDPLVWTQPAGTHEKLLRWMATRLGRSWPIPVEVAVDAETVFVRGEDGACRAIPLAVLRARRDHGVDAVYVFGRYAQLPMLGRREGCPVRARLDEVLAQRGA